MVDKDIEKFYRTIGDLISSERHRVGRSQEDLALYLNLTRTSVINLEKGRHKPSIYQLLLIADFFDIEYTKLIPMVANETSESKPLKISDLNNMIIDQETVNKKTKNAVMEFLTSIKK